MEFIDLGPVTRQQMVEVAACMMAADGIALAIEEERNRNAPYPGLSSDETIKAEELALKIAKWIRVHNDELVQAVAEGG